MARLGSSLPTDTANTTAVQAAINLALTTGAELYFPCGVYNVNSPLTMFGPLSPAIQGGGAQCTKVQYTGSTPVTAGMLTIAASAPATNCTSVSCDPITGEPTCCSVTPKIHDISFVGNTNVPDELDLLVAAGPDINRVNLAGSGTSGLFCMACGSGGSIGNIGLGAGTIYGYTANNTPNGLVFDGYGSGSAANKLIVSSVGAAGMPGAAILVRNNSTALQFENCQLSGNLYNIHVAGGSGAVFNNCLSEDGGLGGETLVDAAATSTTFTNSDFSGTTIINGSSTVIRDGSASTLTIGSTATGTLVDNLKMVGGNIVNSAYDTEFRNIQNAATNDTIYNFPAWRRVPPSSLGANAGVFLTGTWNIPTAGTFQAFDPTPITNTATPWRVQINAWIFGADGGGGGPTWLELSSTNPTYSLPAGGTLTVSISGGLIGASTSGAGGNTIIFGNVNYFPLTTTDSAMFAGNVFMPALTLNGGTKITSQSSANSQMVTCPSGGSGTQYCDAAGAWVSPTSGIPVRAGAWSISSSTSATITFGTAMGSTPTSCSVTPTASAAPTGTPFATSLATTGFTVNVPVSGTLAGTYQCVINNAN